MIRLEMIKSIIEKKGRRIAEIIQIDSNRLKIRSWCLIYHGWMNSIVRELKPISSMRFVFIDYSPVINSNNDYLKSGKEKRTHSSRKGYQYEHPEEAADILIKQGPALPTKVIS